MLLESYSFYSIPDSAKKLAEQLVLPLANMVKKVTTKLTQAGVMLIQKMVPMKFKGLDVRLPGVTLKFDYDVDAGESGKANNSSLP